MRKVWISISASLALVLWVSAATVSADTHWANLSGSNEVPYTSYATGAHKIQDAIDESEAGDTVRIAAGEYNPDTTIYLQDSLVIIGAGRDSTIIAALYDASPYEVSTIMLLTGASGGGGGGFTLQDCSIWGEKDEIPGPFCRYLKYGIQIFYQIDESNLIECNTFKYCHKSVYIHQAETTIRGNRFESNDRAITLGSSGPYEVANNHIMANCQLDRGVVTGLYLTGPTHIHHNTIILPNGGAIFLENDGDSLLIHNNLLVSGKYEALSLFCYTDGAVVRNNTIIRNWENDHQSWRTAWFEVGGSSKVLIENNAFYSLESMVGLYMSEWVPGGGEFEISHNSFWRVDSGRTGVYHYDTGVVLDTADNIFENPMFVDDSTYYLQRGSPLIDAGSPLLHDPDGSYSDIGWTGGPEGFSYEYPEMPPDEPDTLIGQRLDDFVSLLWLQNTESDMAGYRLYRDTYFGFVPNGNNMLAEIGIEETTYVDTITGLENDLFYVLTAVDTAAMESSPSNEVAVLWTGILDEDITSSSVPRTPIIIGNYPNPFNSSTTIEYYIPDIGAQPAHVQLDVYNILGRRIISLVNKRQYPGNHLASWNGCDDSGNPVSSGVYFARLTLWGYEFASSTKLVLQK